MAEAVEIAELDVAGSEDIAALDVAGSEEIAEP